DRADVESAVDRLGVEQHTGQEAADEGADDAEDDVPDDAEALVTADEETGEIPGDGAEDDPRDDAHSVTSVPPAGFSSACWVSESRVGTGPQCRRQKYRPGQRLQPAA